MFREHKKGITFAPDHALDPAALTRVADETLYAVKAQKATRNSWWAVAG